MDPVRGNDGVHLVDLEDTARPGGEVGELRVGAVEVHLDGGAVVGERIQADVRLARRADGHQAPHLLLAHEGVDRLARDVGVVVVVDHASDPPDAQLHAIGG
jgi:hypothetical protein